MSFRKITDKELIEAYDALHLYAEWLQIKTVTQNVYGPEAYAIEVHAETAYNDEGYGPLRIEAKTVFTQDDHEIDYEDYDFSTKWWAAQEIEKYDQWDVENAAQDAFSAISVENHPGLKWQRDYGSNTAEFTYRYVFDSPPSIPELFIEEEFVPRWDV